MKTYKYLLSRVMTALLALALVPLSAQAQQPPQQGRAVLMIPTWENRYPQCSNVPPVMDFIAVAGADDHAVGLRSDGSLASWAYYSGPVSDTPTGNDFVDVAAGRGWSVALHRDGSLTAWGYDGYHTVTGIPTGLHFVAVQAGYYHGVALADDGTLHSWGDDFWYQLSGTPTGNDFVRIVAGAYGSAAIRADGSFVLWGQPTEYDQMYFHDTPQPPGLRVKSLSISEHAVAAVALDGSLAVWGDKDFVTWAALPTGNDFVEVSMDLDCGVARRADGSLATWGRANATYSTFNAPAGNDFIALGKPGYSCHFAIRTANHTPRPPDLGQDRTVGGVHTGYPGTDIELYPDVISDLDPDNDTLTYTISENGTVLFQKTVAPLCFVGGSGPQPQSYEHGLYVSPSPGVHTFRLTVTVPFGESAFDEVTLTVVPQPNQAPVANAGQDTTYYLPHSGNPAADLYRSDMEPFTGLDGSASYDPDGDWIDAFWTDERGNVIGWSLTVGGYWDWWGLGSYDANGNWIDGLTVGDHTYTLTVTDPYGATATSTTTIHIVEPNGAPTITVPTTAAVNIGCPVTVLATATDPDGDSLTFSKATGPSWATVSATGAVTLNPPSGTTGNVTVGVTVTDPYGASDQKNISVTVCPIVIDGVTLYKKNGITTVQFNVRNTDGTTVNSVSLNSSTLNGTATMTAMPITFTQLKQTVSKQVQLKFNGVPSGPAQFIVNGTSSAGPVNANMTVNVP